jgi:hypothetical protein
MFAHIKDWSTLDGMFPTPDQIIKELDDFFGPIDEAISVLDDVLPPFELPTLPFDRPVLNDMFAHIKDWSTLDGMFPPPDQIIKELDDFFGPIDEAMGIKRSRRTAKKPPR